VFTGLAMGNKQNIDILLATYNGQKYLREQIDSILSQSNQDWQLVIRDDKSLDDTLSIIKDYLARYPDKIKLIEDNGCHLGAKLNFQCLLEHSTAEYIMFCDQDDVWLPQKIDITLNAMKVAEKNFHNKPIMIHSDLVVVDANLKKVASSLWTYQKVVPSKNDDLNRIILQNVATGCTIMINSKAKDVSLPIPEEAVMHDWWIALKVAQYGKILHIPKQLVLYRQHTGNLVGAKKTIKKNFWEFWGGFLSLKARMINHYKMIKKHNPDAIMWLVVLKKVFRKIAQQFK
jgi:glycosyltransferase involved in cell wall biosynthesis